MTPAQTAAADLAAAVVEFGERLPGWWWGLDKFPVQGFARAGDGISILLTSGPHDDPAAALRAVMQQALDASLDQTRQTT